MAVPLEYAVVYIICFRYPVLEALALRCCFLFIVLSICLCSSDLDALALRCCTSVNLTCQLPLAELVL